MRKLIFSLLTISFLFACSFAKAQNYNYAEALQKSMFFYEAQRAGEMPEDNRVSWRSDACANDGSDVGLDLNGGWFDAGDHIKFNFPMAYSVTTLCWGAIEFPDGYKNSSQMDYLKSNIKYVTDYLIKCHTSPNEFYAQVGDGTDHSYWIPAEMVELSYDRKSFKIDQSNPGTDLAGESAAALAAASMLFKDSDPSYASTLLSHAEELYSFADNYRGKYSDAISAVNPYYTSWSGYQDELVWGAIWLYMASGNSDYLDKARSEYESLSNEGQSSLKSYGWTVAWDDKSYACYVLMAKATGEQQYKDDAERWLNQWFTDRTESTGPSFTPSGFPILDSWGSNRYAANTAFCMLAYSKLAETTIASKYETRAKWIVDYLLGNNPQNTSYVIGFGDKYPLYPHHRTAHGSWNRDEYLPAETRHTLYGALVGGHKTTSDTDWTDDRHDYYWNEVATDYNSCFSGCLAGLNESYSASPLSNFPVKETPVDEFMIEARINSSSNTYSEWAIWVENHTSWPARVPSSWKYRLFIDISEAIDAGYTLEDIYVEGRGTATYTQLLAWDAASNIYYSEVTVNSDIIIFPGGQSESKEESQIRIGVPNDAPVGSWDASNDWSFQGLSSTLMAYEKIPLYADGVLVYGSLPGDPQENIPPIAVASANTTSGTAPLSVTFSGAGSTDSDGTISSYSWNFDDGTTETGSSVTHSFTTAGTYSVVLTVVDNAGASSTDNISIVVEETPVLAPVASFTASATGGTAPVTITFDASSSTDPNGQSLSYSWDFGDESTASGVSVSHLYTTASKYTVVLTVTNESGLIDNAETDVVIGSEAMPVSGVSISQEELTIYVNQTAQLQATVEPADASNQNVIWYTSDDGVALVSSTGLVTAVGEGIAEITVETEENGFTATCVVNVIVVNNAPIADISASSEALAVEETLTLSAAGSTDPDDDVLSYSWNFGDGSSAEGVDVTHAYSEEGDFVITLTVSDGALESTANVSIHIGDITYPCSSPITATLPIVIDGEGSFCYEVCNQSIVYVNSWNTSLVTINDEDFTNTWSDEIPNKINDCYYVYYEGLYPWSHMEVASLKGAASLADLNNNFSLYPNPFKENVSLTISNASLVESMSLVDQLGRVVKLFSDSEISNTMEFGQELPTGVYYLLINTTQGINRYIISKN